MKQYTILGVRIDDLSEPELETCLQTWMQTGEGKVVVTPNAEILLQAQRNPVFTRLLNESDLAMVDSVSLTYAVGALYHQNIHHREPGVDLLNRLCRIASSKSARVLLLGGAPGSAQQSARHLKEARPSLEIFSLDPGVVTWSGSRLEITSELVESIRALQPTVIAVALGQYKQEQFIHQMKQQLPFVRIWIGVGGALEMISGQKRRAPHALSRMGLEWLWRLLLEPRRIGRILNATVIFPFLILRQTLRQHHFIKSTRFVLSQLVHSFRL